MMLKRWLLILAAITLVPTMAPADATATIATPIGEQLGTPTTTTGDGEELSEEEAEPLPEWIGTRASGDIGVPANRIGLQPQVSPVGQRAAAFHNNWLMPLIVAISIFVLALLLYAMIKFRRSANPEPSRTTHHVGLEVAWTLVPVLILIVIAVPSIGLIRAQYNAPPADVVVKVTGNQWNWEYEYPDHGAFSFISNMLPEQGDAADGERYRTDGDGPALLAVDERIVIPAGQTVKFIVTASDVIHSFAIPAFWIKTDAIPGRLNETWVKVDEPGVYFGQCSELCGARHAYMPIAVEVVPPADFERWVASKGGAMPAEIARREAAEARAAAAEAAAAEAAAEQDTLDNPGTPAEAQPNEATPVAPTT